MLINYNLSHAGFGQFHGNIFTIDILKFLITTAWEGKFISHKQYEDMAVKPAVFYPGFKIRKHITPSNSFFRQYINHSGRSRNLPRSQSSKSIIFIKFVSTATRET